MTKRVIIVAGGHVELDELDMIETDDLIVTADAGVVPVLNKGMLPHLAVGDFDTMDQSVLKKIEQEGISHKKLPIHKDETDSHYAVRAAMEYNPEELIILGALGGARFDHMLGNIGLLEWLADKDVSAVLVHKSNRIRLLVGPVSWSVSKSSFSYISLIPVSSRVSGVTTQGLLYSLYNETLYRGLTQGISNELTNERGTVFIEKGKCLGVESKDL